MYDHRDSGRYLVQGAKPERDGVLKRDSRRIKSGQFAGRFFDQTDDHQSITKKAFFWLAEDMLMNYLRTAVRSLWKNKAFSAINIIGLAAGLAVCLLIVLYVSDETSYDRYNVNADRIYRLNADIFFNNTQFNAATAPRPLGPALVKDYPQVEQMTQVVFQGNILVKKGDANIQDQQAAFVDSTFFRVFTIPALRGDLNTALTAPGAIVIDESTAKKYFNSVDVAGRTLYIDNTTPCKITAVIKDIPRASHFHFHFLRPLRDAYQGAKDDWLTNYTWTYILLKPGVDRASMQARVDQTVHTYVYKALEAVLHTSTADMQRTGAHFRYRLMPLTDIHLQSNLTFEIEANGNGSYVYSFSVIAALILLIACVNFMNLSTARSANRAKEVGVRKVMGSGRIPLISQFLTESVLLSLISMLLALGLTMLALPAFDQLSGKQLQISTLWSPWFLAVSLGLVLLVGFLAGSYPAFYLSSFQPIHVLKSRIATGFKSSRLRSALVVFQFSISIVLIIGTIVIYNQLNYIRNRETGYSREQVMVLHHANHMGNKIRTFRQQLLQLSGVNNATITGGLPTAEPGSINQSGWFREPSLDAKKGIIVSSFWADEHYIPTLKMQMAAGRNFSPDFLSDSSAVIINESAARLFGVEDPLNMRLYRPDYYNNKGILTFHVVGVVKDFNFSTMHEKIGPLIMQLGDDWNSDIAIAIRPGNIPSLIGEVEKKWRSMAPGMPFSYSFMDSDFDKLYHADQLTGRLFITFALFAILIACLGLLGLVTYAAEQRTKEIGIRKVLGAKVGTIVVLLSRDFTRLVLIASLIAFPTAWWAMNKWLESFAYRVSIGWWVFLVAGVLALGIALLTVSFQTIRAALANPVESLKTE
jgi:putative ABC transport system permease protein